MKKKIVYPILLVALIVMCLFRFTWYFVNEKEGFHCDEAWSYGFANSEYDPFIYSYNTDILKTFDNLRYYNTWVAGEVYKDYLQVNDGESFHFASVIYNKSGDMSPSLFELILHFICSFFPNTFSWWYAYVINVVFMFVTLLVVYKLCNLLQNKKYISLLVTAFYGLSLGAFNTELYLRMYSMLTFFTILTFYLFERINQSEKLSIKLCIAMFLTVFLGGFTHFYYFLFVFFLTGFYCLFLLISKRVKKCFTVGGLMLISVAIYFLIYPAAISMIFSSGNMYEGAMTYPYKICWSYCLAWLSVESFGVPWFLDRFLLAYVLGVLFALTVIVTLLMFLFRNETYYDKFKEKVFSILKLAKQYILRLLHFILKKENYVCEAALISVFLSLAVIAKVSNITNMGYYGDRYIFYLYPVYIVCVLVPFSLLVGKKNIIKIVYSSFYVLILVASLFLQIKASNTSNYLFKTGGNTTDLTELFTDSDVIIVSNNPSRLEWYDVFLMYSNQSILFSKYDVILSEDNFKDMYHEKPVYILIEQLSDDTIVGARTDEEIIDILGSYNDFYNGAELAFSQSTYFGAVNVYSVK